MQLWHKVLIHKGDQWMTEEELRQHYLKRVDPRTELMENYHLVDPAIGPGLLG